MSSQIIPQFPCKNRPDRYPACHDKCEKYLTVKRAHNEKKEAIRRDRFPDEYIIGSVLDKREILLQSVDDLLLACGRIQDERR